MLNFRIAAGVKEIQQGGGRPVRTCDFKRVITCSGNLFGTGFCQVVLMLQGNLHQLPAGDQLLGIVVAEYKGPGNSGGLHSGNSVAEGLFRPDTFLVSRRHGSGINKIPCKYNQIRLLRFEHAFHQLPGTLVLSSSVHPVKISELHNGKGSVLSE
ncbi:hypothetical protein D3C80_1379230 [compost metagenome]